MAIIRQGGSNPYPGKVMTTRGFRDASAERLCYGCGQYKVDDLFTIDANGKVVCPDCAGSKGEGVLRQECADPNSCACEKVNDVEADPAG